MPTKNIIILFLIISFTIANSVYAEEIMEWMECVKEAKIKNPTLMSATEKVNQALANKEITRSVVMPQITGNADRTTSQQPSGGGTASSMVSASSAKRKPATTYEYDITGALGRH